MEPKLKKEAYASPKTEAKAKALKAKKAGQKEVHSHTHTHTHTHKIQISPIFWWPKTLSLWRQPQKNTCKGKQALSLCHHQVLSHYWVNHEEYRRT